MCVGCMNPKEMKTTGGACATASTAGRLSYSAGVVC